MNTRTEDTFQYQFKKFKYLLIGSKSAKIASIILIAMSLVLIFIARNDLSQVIPLLIGAIGLYIYIFKFLSIKNIQQKAYTQTSLISSISKFKAYMANRKKYEMYFMALWIVSLIPFVASNITSNSIAVIGAGIYIALVAAFGALAFKKIDKDILGLETVMQKELEAFK